MKKILIAAAALAVLGIVVVASLKQAGSRGRGIKVYMEDAAKQPRLLETVSATGEIRPRVEVNISSQVMGQIVGLPVEEGDMVKEGQILVQLDPERYRSEVQRLEAVLRMSSVNIEKERVSLKTAESTLRRQESLHRQQILSDEMLDQARLAVDSSSIQLRSLDEQVRQVEADLGRAKDDLARTTLRAPISGLVSRLNAKLGEQVIIGTMNNPGTVILTLSDMAEVLAEVRVDETDVTSLRPSQKAELRVDAVEEKAYHGVVESIGNMAVREGNVSRFPVKILLSDPDTQLRPGMSVRAAVESDEKLDVLAIPLQALVRRNLKDFLAEPDAKKSPRGGAGVEAAAKSDDPKAPGSSDKPGVAAKDEVVDPEREQVQVVIVERDGKARMARVTTGISDAFRIEIIEGVSPGDRVILGPYRRLRSLKNGDAVRRVEKEDVSAEDEGKSGG